jgi:hypothetical protein
MQTLETESDPLLGDSIRSSRSIDSAGSGSSIVFDGLASESSAAGGAAAGKFYVYDPDDENVSFGTWNDVEFSAGSAYSPRKDYKIIYGTV